jgi:diguanylate cyclase (GGDEF)-like protein
LDELGRTDALTGLANRRQCLALVESELARHRRNGRPAVLVILDIDHFKSINDRFGHATGDEVLKAVAAALKGSLRNIDMVFRYGGEEFLVLLSNTSREAAQIIGERLRLAVLGLQYLEEGRALEISISLGCATLLPGESSESLQRRADNALYVSKREGRNRLSMAG